MRVPTRRFRVRRPRFPRRAEPVGSAPCRPRRCAPSATATAPMPASLIATVEDGRLVRLGGDPAHPVTKGFLCSRTSQFPARQNSPDRLTTPLLRDGSGFRAISWEDALAFAAERLLAIRAESGPAAILHYRSGGSLGLVKSVVDYFFELLGPVTVKRGDICSGAGDAAQEADFGDEESHDFFDLAHSKGILLWGKNPFVSSVHLLPLLKEAKARGARLVLIDPVRHKTASLADAYIAPRPGGDLALALGVAALLFETGRVIPGAASFCEGFDAFRSLALSKLPASWAEEAGVGPDTLELLAVDALRSPLQHPGRLGNGPEDERLGDRPRSRRPRRPHRESRHPRGRRELLLQEARRVRHVVPDEVLGPDPLRAAPRQGDPRGAGSLRSGPSGSRRGTRSRCSPTRPRSREPSKRGSSSSSSTPS